MTFSLQWDILGQKGGIPMREYLKNMKISFILAALLSIALGVVLLLWPGITTTVICYAFGAILAVHGLVSIVSFFFSRTGGFAFELLLGIVSGALGVLFLVQPQIIISILPVAIGLFIMVDGLVNLKRAFELRRLEYGRWGVTLLLSLVSVGLGLLVLFHPYLAAEALVMVIGGVLIYEGLSDLWAIFMVTRLTKELRKRMPIEVDPIDVE